MRSKINVVSLTNDMGIGGTARQVTSVERDLNKEFFNHFVISLGSKKDPRTRFVDNNKIFFLSDPKAIAKMLKDNKIDVLYVHRHGRNDPAHDRIVKEIDDNIALLEMNTFSSMDKGYFGQRCDKHVFVSQTNVIKYCVQNKVTFDFKKHKVLYGLVDTGNFNSHMPTDREIVEYKNALGINGCPVIGRMSRPVMEKWDDEMLVMWKKLSKINPKIKFLIYGVPSTRKKLLLDSGIADNVIMLEPTVSDKELALFYSVIDILIHDSQIGECNSGTIAEAMLFKKPVVVRSTPFPKHIRGRNYTPDNGQIEQIKNGWNGYVVTNGSAMAHTVADLLQKPGVIKKMGQKNHEEIFAKYEVSVGIKTLEKIFIEAALEKNPDASAQVLHYYDSLRFYPDENDVRNWFSEYYLRLTDMYGNDYQNSFFEKAELAYLKYHRKLKTIFSYIGL